MCIHYYHPAGHIFKELLVGTFVSIRRLSTPKWLNYIEDIYTAMKICQLIIIHLYIYIYIYIYILEDQCNYVTDYVTM